MEFLEHVAIIIALIAGFGYIVDLIVRPLKETINKHETELTEIKKNQTKFRDEFNQRLTKLEAGQAEIIRIILKDKS